MTRSFFNANSFGNRNANWTLLSFSIWQSNQGFPFCSDCSVLKRGICISSLNFPNSEKNKVPRITLKMSRCPPKNAARCNMECSFHQTLRITSLLFSLYFGYIFPRFGLMFKAVQGCIPPVAPEMEGQSIKM